MGSVSHHFISFWSISNCQQDLNHSHFFQNPFIISKCSMFERNLSFSYHFRISPFKSSQESVKMPCRLLGFKYTHSHFPESLWKVGCKETLYLHIKSTSWPPEHKCKRKIHCEEVQSPSKTKASSKPFRLPTPPTFLYPFHYEAPYGHIYLPQRKLTFAHCQKNCTLNSQQTLWIVLPSWKCRLSKWPLAEPADDLQQLF